MKLFYSFLLVMLTSFFVIANGIRVVDKFMLMAPAGQSPLLDRIVNDFAAQIPVMTLQNGVLQVKATQPYIVHLNIPQTPSTKEMSVALVTIDTGGATTVHTMETPVLITAQEIYIRNNHETKVYPLTKSEESAKPLIINRAMATDSAERGLNWIHTNTWKIYLVFGAIAWISFGLAWYLLRLIMLMALGLVGLALSSIIWKPTAEFATAVRIAAVAYTPVAIFSTVALCFAGHSPKAIVLFALGALITAAALSVSRGE